MMQPIDTFEVLKVLLSQSRLGQPKVLQLFAASSLFFHLINREPNSRANDF